MAYNVAYGNDQRNEDSREVSLDEYEDGYLAPVPLADPPLPEGYSYVTPDPPKGDQPKKSNNEPESPLYTELVP